MISFRKPDNEALVLEHSPLIRAITMTLGYMDEHGSIGLTKSGLLNRKFVHWAAEEFLWPGLSHEELFSINKVLNEQDFPACELIRELLLYFKIARRYKGTFVLTPKGRKLVGKPLDLYELVMPVYLFQVDHNYGITEPPIGNWDIFLNVMNVELTQPRTGEELAAIFYGSDRPKHGYRDDALTSLYLHVLRPLCWAGFLTTPQEQRFATASAEKQFSKTPLWPAGLDLETDHQARSMPTNDNEPPTLH